MEKWKNIKLKLSRDRNGQGIYWLKSCTDVANNWLVIDLWLDVQIACNGLQQKFQQSEYFTCDPLISSHHLSLIFTSFPMICDDAIISAIEWKLASQVNHRK